MRWPRRGGYTVLEMLVSIVVGTIAIGAVGSFAFRQQRFHRDVAVVVERLDQLEQAASMMPISLRAIAPGESDIPPGGAQDTALEFRAVIASAVVCDSGQGVLLLAPSHTDPPRLASLLTRPGAGDTVWSLTLGDDTNSWLPSAIAGVSDSVTSCIIGGASPWGSGPRSAIVVHVASPLAAGAGSVIRITRTWRYSIYRASDGAWYLGAKEWNPAALRFNTIQPVSGPFVPPSRAGAAFRYFNASGNPVTSGATDTRSIALIDIALQVDSTMPGTGAHAIGIGPRITASVALRNAAR